ncbi:MAG: hypothetical protein E7456_01545 [Ruminococcaceae bacterium]|nr:hypothetical protein [Oscillospiraceae bacterium]
MSISFGGIGEMCVTLMAASGVTKGKPVKMSTNGTVAACSDGDRFVGVAVDVSDDGYAIVQLKGYTTMGYTGTAPTVGYNVLAANAAGGVKGANAGNECLVLEVDTTAATVGFII